MKTLLTICALSFASVAMAADTCPISGKPADLHGIFILSLLI